MEPSVYQRAIFSEVARQYEVGKYRDIVITAVAGSGKSTTLKLLLEYIPPAKSVLYLTFGKEINLDLDKKIKSHVRDMRTQGLAAPDYTCRTVHSMGNSCLTGIGIKGDAVKGGRKYNHLAQNYLKVHMRDYDYQLSEQLKKLIDMVRLTLTEPTERNLLKLLARFTDIQIDPEDDDTWRLIVHAVPSLLEAGIQQAKTANIIDFTDQIWLPSSQALDLSPTLYDVVLVDEAQDLSPCQRELALKACKKSGLRIFVGDKDQAIFGFAGASLYSIDEIIEATGALELPLSICYRCPRKVVELAATIRSGIECSPFVPDGQVEYIRAGRVIDLAQPKDLILCRLTAPLVETCLELLRAKKRATVRGKDLGKDFTSLMDKIIKFMRGRGVQCSLDDFYNGMPHFALEYESFMIEILSENEEENEERITRLQDNIATLLVLQEGHKSETPLDGEIFPADYNGFLTFVGVFFKEDKFAQIILSTGHRAKGLEFPRVFILQYDQLPHPRAKTPEQIRQENNLIYVMITRALADQNDVEQSGKLFLTVDNPELYTRMEKSVPSVALVHRPLVDSRQLVAAEVSRSFQSVPMQESVVYADSANQSKKRGRPTGTTKEIKKVRFDARLSPETLEALDACIVLQPEKNKTDVVEEAIRYYLEALQGGKI